MARPLARLRKAQVGSETVWGTPVAATYILPGLRTVRWQPTDQIVLAEKLNGSLAVSDGADITGKSAAAVLGGYLCPQTLPYLLEGAYGAITPAVDAGTPIAYSRVAAPPLTSEAVPKSRTLEVGSNISQSQWQIAGALPASFDITGRIGDFAMFESRWIGRALVAHAFTSPLTAGPYSKLKAKNAKFFVDNVSGTIGTTPLAACVTEFAFHSGNLWALANCMDGQLEASGYAEEPQQPSLTLTLQLGADTLALFGDMEAGQQKLVRFQLDGKQIHGGTAVNERIQIDMAANITSWPDVGDTEAEHGMVAAITFTGTQDLAGAFAKLISYLVVSDAATLV
jgi:hypothetical protein